MTTGEAQDRARHAEAGDMLKHLTDLEDDLVGGHPRDYDPVELVRYALAWPMDYWVAHALKWLEQGVRADELGLELGRIATDAQRSQALHRRAERLRRSPHRP